MKPLLEFDSHSPIATTVVGITAGAAAWICAHTSEITGFAGMIGAICSASIGLIVLGTKIVHAAQRFGRGTRTWLRNRRARRAFLSAPVLPDDDDDFRLP